MQLLGWGGASGSSAGVPSTTEKLPSTSNITRSMRPIFHSISVVMLSDGWGMNMGVNPVNTLDVSVYVTGLMVAEVIVDVTAETCVTVVRKSKQLRKS